MIMQDDKDEGTSFWYTGQGGNSAGVQVKDQTWEQGNVALRVSCEKKLPVRVMRGSKVGKTKLQYVYDGLYLVKEYKIVVSVWNLEVITDLWHQ